MPAIEGARFATAAAGIRYHGRADVLLVILDPATAVAGVFTKSKCPSAPVEWCRAKLKRRKARALVVNSGNANAFTGKTGRAACQLTADLAANAVCCRPDEVFLASTGPGDAGYEIQILDSYDNKTYVNGQAASIYKQYPPLVNAMRKPGEWQSYDVVWTAPTFHDDGTLATPAYVTAFQNGVLVQNHVALKGETVYIGAPSYRKHGAAPIKLQAHGDPSAPIAFRNIWVRDLDEK